MRTTVLALIGCLTILISGSTFAWCGWGGCPSGYPSCGNGCASACPYGSECECTDPYCHSSDRTCISSCECCEAFGNVGAR